MTEEKKITGRGGAGRGQGRKPEGKVPKKTMPVRVSIETRVDEFIAAEGSSFRRVSARDDIQG